MPRARTASESLRALTAAALALPGLAASAEPQDALRLQYGRYEEDARRLPGVESRFDPIDVDYMSLGATVSLADRLRVSLDYRQDTWSGATPIASAPRSLFGNRASAPDGVSGATPYLAGDLYLDGELRVLESDRFGQLSGRLDPGLVHTLSGASPETRKAIDLGVAYEWDDASLSTQGGFSSEPDYLSGFLRVAGRLDLERKRTSVELSARHANSAIEARLDHDAVPYIDFMSVESRLHGRRSGSPALRDARDDASVALSFSRVMTSTTRLDASLEWRHAAGYLANPYKVVQVAFLDPAQQFLAPPGGYFGDVHALIERRPDTRDQGVLAARLLQDVAPLRAAASLRYAYARDDWGIDAHTLEGEWRQQLGATWLLTPRVRYTTQSAADFYRPFLVSRQAYATLVTDPEGNVVSIVPFDPGLLPGSYSGDHRLSAFGVVSAGFAIQKRLLRAFVLDLGFEYSRYAGSLRLGGGGEGDFARFDAWQLGASLRVDLAALALARSNAREVELVERAGGGSDAEAEDAAHAAHAAGHRADHGHLVAPAGVMYAHSLPAPGDFMLGYRTMYMRRGSDFQTGSRGPSDAELVLRACAPVDCSAAADSMVHQMHMLDLMFAPTAWLTLMAMPSYVDQEMSLRALDGAVPDVHASHDRHATGGFGDTRLGPLVSLLRRRDDEAILGLLVSAPSGDTGVRFRRDHQTERGFLHYDMQLGSGTWDFLPSLTYQGQRGPWRLGMQAAGSVRMEREGRTGYALGDEVQVSAWSGVELFDAIGLTLRGIYTFQGGIRGRFDRPSSQRTPADHPANSGASLVDLGIGVSARVARGSFEGMQLSLEWIQPLAENWSGHQLERTGSLAASWSMPF